MTDDDRLTDLLVDWEDAFVQGRDVPPAELCADCPHLTVRVAAEVAKLRRVTAGDLAVGAGEPSLPVGGSRYRPLRFHAEGGLGRVFVAYDEELGREVAFKQLHESASVRADARDRFQREAEITGRLEHPGIVPVYGLGRDDAGQPFYAMRFVRGDSLRDAIAAFHAADPGRALQNGGLPLRGLLARLVAVCNAVAYAHSRGIIHRDLKPANVMLGRYGETLVVDWGLAKSVGRGVAHRDPSEDTLLPPVEGGTRVGEAVGTPGFMSPEQANGRGAEVGPASDVFALGATLYAVLTGVPPYQGPGALADARAAAFPAPRAVRPDVPAALEAVCLKAMAGRPGDRYLTALDLAQDVERWLADEPVSAYREPPKQRAWRWARDHRSGVTAAVAALLVGAVALAVSTALLTKAYAGERAERQRAETATERERVERQNAENAAARARAAETETEFGRDALLAVFAAMAPSSRSDPHDREAQREELLDRAIAMYEANPRWTNTPRLQVAFGQAYGWRAARRDDAGEFAAALEDARRMRDVFSDLVKGAPAVPEYQQALASGHWAAGRALAVQANFREAESEYREAIKFYHQPAVRASFESRRAYASALHDLGHMLAHPNAHPPRHADAIKNLDEAVKLRTELVNEKARDGPAAAQTWALRSDLASSYAARGTARREQGDTTTAKADYDEALALYKSLNISPAAAPVDVERLGRFYQQFGLFHADTGFPQLAEEYLSNALGVWQSLAQRFPAAPEYACCLADAHLTWAKLLREGDYDRSQDYCKRAIDLLEGYRERHPRAERVRGVLMSAFLERGTGRSAHGKNGDAVADYTRVIDTLKDEQTRGVASIPTRVTLAAAYAKRAAAFATLGRYDDALRDCRAADDLTPDIETATTLFVTRAAALIATQKYDELIRRGAEYQKRVDTELKDEATSAVTATMVAALLTTAGGEARTAGKGDEAARCLDAAIGHLRAAQAAGYFNDPARVAELEEGLGFDPLRQHREYKKLVAELKRKK